MGEYNRAQLIDSVKRVFRYGSNIDYLFQSIAAVAAIASGAGIALQTLIFGSLITTMSEFVSGASSPSVFRDEASHFAYATTLDFLASLGSTVQECFCLTFSQTLLRLSWSCKVLPCLHIQPTLYIHSTPYRSPHPL